MSAGVRAAEPHEVLRRILSDDGIMEDLDVIIVEFATATYQDVLDAFIRGEDVPLDELSALWRNTSTSPIAPWDSPLYLAFLETVRNTNRRLPPGKKVRVLGGGPLMRPPMGPGDGRNPITWLWPVVLWSAMGNRERRHDTHQIVFSVAHPLRRHLWATWAAGFVVAVLLGAGVLLRLVAAERWASSAAWCAGAVFIPSLALALGTWSSGTRLFEITYVVWWYLGPLNGIGPLDFTGVTSEPDHAWVAVPYGVAAMALMGAAWLGRRRQIRG